MYIYVYIYASPDPSSQDRRRCGPGSVHIQYTTYNIYFGLLATASASAPALFPALRSAVVV